MSKTVRDNSERNRYELEIDGQIVFARYRRDGTTLFILHVEAPPALRGTGAAGRLAASRSCRCAATPPPGFAVTASSASPSPDQAARLAPRSDRIEDRLSPLLVFRGRDQLLIEKVAKRS
jgi:hypothetical protein